MRNKLGSSIAVTNMEWGHLNRVLNQLFKILGADASRLFNLLEGARDEHALRRLAQSAKYAFMDLTDSERFAVKEFGAERIFTRGNIIYELGVTEESFHVFQRSADSEERTMFPSVPIPNKFLSPSLWNALKEYEPYLVYVPAMTPMDMLRLAFRIDPQYQRFEYVKHERAHWIMTFGCLLPVNGSWIQTPNCEVEVLKRIFSVPSFGELAMISSLTEAFSELERERLVVIKEESANLEIIPSHTADPQSDGSIGVKKAWTSEKGARNWISIHTLTRKEVNDESRAVKLVIR